MTRMHRFQGLAVTLIVTGALLALGGAGAPAARAESSPGARPGAETAAVQTAQAGRSDGPRTDRAARAQFIDRQGNRIGDATLEQTPHGVVIRVDLQNVPPGVRGFHIHSLLAEDGTALVIHERADDSHSHPSGEAGGRAACAVIQG